MFFLLFNHCDEFEQSINNGKPFEQTRLPHCNVETTLQCSTLQGSRRKCTQFIAQMDTAQLVERSARRPQRRLRSGSNEDLIQVSQIENFLHLSPKDRHFQHGNCFHHLVKPTLPT